MQNWYTYQHAKMSLNNKASTQYFTCLELAPSKQNVSIVQADKFEAASSSLHVMQPRKCAAYVDNQSQQ